ncbi:MAG: site-specific DNA-methyltransferase [Thermoflexales bacterium]|nr:site-specific DNA-methyltransferase [Thermoflexales bacterium]MDW8053632.1 DNA methyltransferase [Anaerolineae bacterium]MDW8292515.1 DNA methyltransferase [Anaerolineae bacterium]
MLARETQAPDLEAFLEAVAYFEAFGTRTRCVPFPDARFDVPVYVNEFWTARQRAANALHEIAYRACFKPPLPRFFIERLTQPGQVVYDPFAGRGTTLLEAALLGRRPLGCDVNPLSRVLVLPRLRPPTIEQVAQRLSALDLDTPVALWEELLVFYHPHTLRQIVNLRRYLLEREAAGALDEVDAWVRMVATNRLTGHSPGFFSVYTLPPNQAVSLEAQRRINAQRNQTPPPREVKALILRKTRSLLRDLDDPTRARLRALSEPTPLFIASADHTPFINDASVTLVVTSPPFLDVVDYQADNWLRCWFNGIDARAVPVWQFRSPAAWRSAMEAVFHELRRVLVPGGVIAFEVGEVRRGTLLLETLVVPAARAAGLEARAVLVNAQRFTKTAHCWGIANLQRGTNTNRVVILTRP